MRVIFACLIVLTVAIPFFIGGGFGLNELLQRCATNNQCDDHDICDNKMCVNACKNKVCHMGATCEAKNHFALCTCLTGYLHDEQSICRKSCRDNTTCSQSEFCMINKCFDVCINNPCRSDEICKTNDDHSYSCICKPGTIRDIDGNDCIKTSFQNAACSGNEDCYKTEKCDHGECIDVCISHYRICNYENEGCLAQNHTAHCTCLPGFIRNQRNNQCVPIN